MSALQFYMLLKLDTLSGTFFVLMTLAIVACIVMLVCFGIASDCGNPKPALNAIKRHFKWIIPIGFICGLFGAFLPTTKEMAAIIVVPKICNAAINNKDLMALPGDIISLASSWIKELRPENIKESAKTVVQQPQHKSTAVDSGK